MPEFSATEQVNPDFNTAFNQAALQGVERQKSVGGLNALAGVDLNDPQSVSNAVGNSIKSGNLDQANALMGVNIANTVNTKILPGYLARLQGQQGQQPQQAQQPQAQSVDPQHMAQTMSMAKQAVDGLLQVPPDQRPAAVEQIKQQFKDRGVPDAAIDSALMSKDGSGAQDLSDENLKGLSQYYDSHAQHFDAHAQGQTPDASQLPTQAGAPWYKSVSEDPYLNDPMMQGILKKYLGVDVEPQLARAAQMAMPEITETAKQNHAFNISQAEASGKVAPTLLEELGKTNIKNQNEPIDIYMAGSTQPQTVTRSQAISMANNGVRFGDKPEPGAEASAKTRGEIEGNLGHPATAMDLENAKSQSANLTKEATDAGNRITSDQYDTGALTARRIISNANSISSGIYTPELGKLAQQIAPALPQSHLAEYANKVELLNQDLAASAKQEFAGMGLPRIANEFKTITDKIPKSASPQDTLKLYGAIKLAKNEMSKDLDHSIMQYDQNTQGSNRNVVAAHTAFDNQRPGLLAYALPELRNMTINGQPAVKEYVSGDGKKLIGVFMPDPKTGKGQNFYIGPGPKQ